MDKLKTKMIEKRIKQVNIALDKDAINDALEICQYLIGNGIEVRLVEMDDKDPSELGFNNITQRICKSISLTSSQLMQRKILGSFSK